MARKRKPVKSPRKRQPLPADRCASLRQQIERVEREIADIQRDLEEPDIPASVKARLRIILRRLLALHRQLLAALKRCEAVPARPRRN